MSMTISCRIKQLVLRAKTSYYSQVLDLERARIRLSALAGKLHGLGMK
jgi:hypothetical protein